MQKLAQYEIDGITFTDNEIIHFDKGIPGFERVKRFIITTRPEHEPFHWLISVDEPATRFVLVNPLLFKEDYDPKFTRSHLADLDIQDKKELLLYVIVTLNPDMTKSTANMLGPILINIRIRRGKQIVFDDNRYSLKEPIIKSGN